MADRIPLKTELGTHVLATGAGIAGFVTWIVQGDRFGNRLPGTFIVKRQNRDETLDLASQPFLLDVLNARIGWVEAYDEKAPKQKGQAPVKVWWADRNKSEPRPPGIKCRQAIQCVLITAAGERMLWEQASGGAVRALLGIFALLNADPSPWYQDEVPALRHVGAVPEGDDQFKTLVPQFRLEGRVPRPAAMDLPLPDDKSRQAQSQGHGIDEEIPLHAPGWDAPAGDISSEIPF
jgi:hypothetical protein